MKQFTIQDEEYCDGALYNSEDLHQYEPELQCVHDLSTDHGQVACTEHREKGTCKCPTDEGIHPNVIFEHLDKGYKALIEYALNKLSKSEVEVILDAHRD